MSETKTDRFDVVFRGFMVLWAVAFYILIFNPFGLSQRLFWGMSTPYHWVITDDIVHHQYLTGSNGKVCAVVYQGLDDQWVVYGFGFDDYHVTKEYAIKKSERNCR